MVRGESVPAQWKAVRQDTLIEMMAGRLQLEVKEIEVQHVHEGVAWLNVKFSDSGLVFSTSISGGDVQLNVFRRGFRWVTMNRSKKQVPEDQFLFRVVEPVREFVSPTTLTKIILVA